MDRPRHQLFAVLLGLSALASPATQADADSEQPNADEASSERALLWTGGMTQVRQPYESAVVELALELTRESHGDYHFEMNHTPFSAGRAEREMRRGEVIDLVSAPLWPTTSADDPPLITIPIPIARGLMGYRLSVVREEKRAAFETITSKEQLRRFTAGLGRDWQEATTFDHNHLPWYAGTDVAQLYTMLERARFDYLPLGSLEARATLDQMALEDELVIAETPIIYYALPVFLQVSTSRAELAERLETGLQEARDSGRLDALFDEHYGELVEQLARKNPQVIELENPDLPGFVDDPGPELFNQRD